LVVILVDLGYALSDVVYLIVFGSVWFAIVFCVSALWFKLFISFLICVEQTCDLQIRCNSTLVKSLVKLYLNLRYRPVRSFI
jgi:hypothetical protein